MFQITDEKDYAAFHEWWEARAMSFPLYYRVVRRRLHWAEDGRERNQSRCCLALARFRKKRKCIDQTNVLMRLARVWEIAWELNRGSSCPDESPENTKIKHRRLQVACNRSAPCTVGNIDNYWLITKSRFCSNLGPKKLIFCNFGAIFSHFSDFGAKFFIHFNFSRPFGRENLNFWASKLVKIYFCAKHFVYFLWAQNGQYFPLCIVEMSVAKWEIFSLFPPMKMISS